MLSTMNELIGAGCLLIGGWCVWKSMRALVRGLMSRSWPVAAGVVLKAKLVKSRSSEGDEISRQDLEYSYSVRGRTYRKKRIRFGIPRSLLWSSDSQRGYRRGEHVDVYYSPSRPTVSALQRGSSPFALIALGGGAVLVWIGVRLLLAP
jgi:Protein of unknown function (DUF3592)